MGAPGQVEINSLTRAEAHLSRDIALLGAAAWSSDQRFGGVTDKGAMLAAEIAAIDPDERAIFVAWSSGQLAGFCRMARDSQDASHWWLQGLLVHPDHQRRGLASALVTEGVRYGRERGAVAIRSMTRVENARSIRFHESFGFERQGNFTLTDGTEMVGFRLATP